MSYNCQSTGYSPLLSLVCYKKLEFLQEARDYLQLKHSPKSE